MNAYYRNKRTGEIKDIVQDSPEFYALQQEVDGSGQSLWEQTSFAHAQAIKVRAATAALNPEDLGKDHAEQIGSAAVQLNAQGVAPENNPHLALTPGEIEAGLTPEAKLEELGDQFDQQGLDRIQGTYGRAAETIRDEEAETPEKQPTAGQSARAGGSDDREGVPRVQAKDGGSGTAQSGGAVSSGQGLGGSPTASSGSGTSGGGGQQQGTPPKSDEAKTPGGGAAS